MSIYPAPNTSNIFNEIDFNSNNDDNNNDCCDDIDINDFVKQGDPISVPSITFIDNTQQHSAFTNSNSEQIETNKENIIELGLKTIDISRSTADNYTEITSLKTNNFKINGNPCEAFSSTDKGKIYENEGNIILHNARITENHDNNVLQDYKINTNEASINNLQTNVTNNTNTLTNHNNSINTHSATLSSHNTRINALENSSGFQFISLPLDINTLMGADATNFPTLNGNTFIRDHEIDIGLLLYNAGYTTDFYYNGIWRNTGRYIINIQFRVAHKGSRVYYFKSGLRMRHMTSNIEHNITSNYIDMGNDEVNGDTSLHQSIMRFNAGEYCLDTYSDQSFYGNYRLFLKIKYHFHTSQDPTRDVKAFFTMRRL